MRDSAPQALLHAAAEAALRDWAHGQGALPCPQATFSGVDHRPTKASPALGEDSRLVLEKYLGLSAHEIETLIQEGAVEVFEAS